MEFNGKKILLEVAKDGGYATKQQLVTAHTLFLDPRIVKQTANQNLFSIIRYISKRGQIVTHEGHQVMCCDNLGPQHAFEWSMGGMKKTDIQINHIYSASKNVHLYTSLANLCATPAFIAKLTDTDVEIQNLLQFRSYDLYGFYQGEVPIKPNGYDELPWREFAPLLPDLEGFLRSRLKDCPKSRSAISAREIGWYFSDYRPDPTI